MINKAITLGDKTLLINYPDQAAEIINFSFSDFQEGLATDATTTLEIQYDKKKNLFSVKDGNEEIGSALDYTDLAILLLTRSTFAFSHAISKGMTLQGAAVQHNGSSLVMIGSNGSGKSMLTAWLLSKGYTYLADDVIYFPDDTDCFHTLTRPLFIKPSGLAIINDFIQLANKENLFLQNKSGTLFSPKIFSNKDVQLPSKPSLLLFVEYNKHSAVTIDTLRPAQAAQRLMPSVVNGRKLKGHGFHQVASITRQIPAMALQYGDFDQLEKVVEPIVNFILNVRCSPSSLRKFIKAFDTLAAEKQTGVANTQKNDQKYPIQKATPKGKKRKLTIGMATYDDYDGVYFSAQALRMYHPEITADSEILVVDNHPDGPCAESLKKLDQSIDGYRYTPLQDVRGTGPVRDGIFHNATGDFVLCIDCHVFIVPGAIKKLLDYFDANPDCMDLLQGPLINDDMVNISTHFDPTWKGGMYGVWGHDKRGDDQAGDPFDIPMQGVGLFACRKQSWPGFNPRFRGFGADEGYIHEKFRQAGGRTLCLPFLRWMHRFSRPMGVPYQIQWKDRIHNYLVGFKELGLCSKPVRDHFTELLGADIAETIYKEIEEEITSPFQYFDAIYCITLNTESKRWQNMEKRFQALGIHKRVRVFKAIETPANHHIGYALSHRAIIMSAKRQHLKNVLVFEDDDLFLDNRLDFTEKSVAELKTQSWNIFYLGDNKKSNEFAKANGCSYLLKPLGLNGTYGLAYNNTVYDQILQELPDTVKTMAQWIQDNQTLDHYLSRLDDILSASPAVTS